MYLLLLSLSIIIIDQFIKRAVSRLLIPGESISLIRNIFHITLVRNKGAAFGILRNHLYFFVVVSVSAILAIAFFLPRMGKRAALTRVALSLVLGGAVSNLIDRIHFGYVIDFLDFRIWPVFNVADSAITIGAILFTVQILRKR